MGGDPWLERWMPLIRERAGPGPVLELGCGTGRDTATLAEAGLQVVALDLSRASIAAAKLRCPSAQFHCQDLRDPFPCGPESTGVVIASLSLHYFDWEETLALVERVRATLRPGGFLVCRLNSTADRHFGAEGHPRIAENFYLVDGAPKRFFDAAAVDALFARGWQVISRREDTSLRYVRPKALWEVIAGKAAG